MRSVFAICLKQNTLFAFWEHSLRPNGSHLACKSVHNNLRHDEANTIHKFDIAQ